MRERGQVSFWNAAEGHGTVRSKARGDELFVHFSFIEPAVGFRALTAGQHVEFTRVPQPGPSGDRFAASAVVVVLPTGRETYEELIAAIALVVADVDPMGLLAAGAPADEYDAEVAKLSGRVVRASTNDVLAREVTSIFDEAFGSGSVPRAVIDQLVERLWHLARNPSSDAG